MDAGRHNDEFLRDGITMELEPGGLFCITAEPCTDHVNKQINVG